MRILRFSIPLCILLLQKRNKIYAFTLPSPNQAFTRTPLFSEQSDDESPEPLKEPAPIVEPAQSEEAYLETLKGRGPNPEQTKELTNFEIVEQRSMAPIELIRQSGLTRNPNHQGEAWKEGKFPKEAPKLITIDPFDTIIQLRSEMGWFFRDILQEATDYNARLGSPEKYTAAFNKAFAEVNRESPCFGVKDGLTSKEWWMKVTQLTYDYVEIEEPGLREDLNEWLIDDVFDVLFHDVFMTEEAWEIKPGAVEALSFYSKWRDEEGNGPIALCVLGNFDERLHAILNELDLLDVFDQVLTSREIGAAMPDRAAFQVAMARSGISDPKTCMHISTKFEEGVVGAGAVGWHPVYIPVTGEQEIPPNTDAELVFSMMGNLFGVLHVWDKEPENRLIVTTRPVLENGVFGFHEKVWEDSDIEEDENIYLQASDRRKSWEGPERF